jgi:hypothetical protein
MKKSTAMMADRQAESFRSYKNIQNSHTLNQRKINKPNKTINQTRA